MTIGSVFAWGKTQGKTVVERHDTAQRYPTHTRVVLPDGAVMSVRVADLSAAKSLLAAQRAAERRLAQRGARLQVTPDEAGAKERA